MNGYGIYQVVVVDEQGEDYPVGLAHETFAGAMHIAKIQQDFYRNFPNTVVEIYEGYKLAWSSKVGA